MKKPPGSGSDVWQLKRLQVKNIRGFDDLRLDFSQASEKHSSWTTIIGANGTGKTTILRAIAIGLSDHSDAETLLAYPFGGMVGNPKRPAEIAIELVKGTQLLSLHTHLERYRTGNAADGYKETARKIPPATTDPSDPLWPSLFICGYGAMRGRRGETPTRSFRIIDTVPTLFDQNSVLVEPELALRRIRDFLSNRFYREVWRGLIRALDLPVRTRFELPAGGGILVTGPTIGHQVSFAGLADGYRINLTWIIDLFARAVAAKAADRNGTIRGVLLVDEIEQHTHPSIQRTLLRKLAEVLPGLQIIVTSHSPVILLSAEGSQIVSLQRNRGKVLRGPVTSIGGGLSAEDVLRHEQLFSTTPYSEEMASALGTQKRAAAIPRRLRKASEKKTLSNSAQYIRQLRKANMSPLARELAKLRRQFEP